MNRFLLLSTAVGLSLLFAGCGSSNIQVTGKVTVDGQPLTKGNISFSPVEKGQVATGTIDAQGNYTLQSGTDKGVPPGNYRVTIVAVEPVEPAPGMPEPPPRLLTPAKYNVPATSGLTAEVNAKQNKFDFDLKSMP